MITVRNYRAPLRNQVAETMPSPNKTDTDHSAKQTDKHVKPLRNINQIHVRLSLGSLPGRYVPDRVRQAEEIIQNERKATEVIFWTVIAS